MLTGLTGSGKTTLAYAIERELFDSGRSVAVLDGEQMRRGISNDLGYSAEDRSENLRRSAYLAKLLNDAGMICVAAFVAPNELVRQKVGHVIGTERFMVIHLATDEATCRQRDIKGHWLQADTGAMVAFPGVTAPYETPEAPALTLNTATQSIAQCVEQVVELLRRRGFIR